MEVIDGHETVVTVCEWESTGNSCGEPSLTEPPDCTQNREGATFIFADGIKTCRCHEQDCYWSDY